MILPLRRHHRRVFTVIGIILPMALIAGIAARKPVPTAMLSPKLFPGGGAFPAEQWERSDLFTKALIHIRLLRETANTKRLAIELSAPKDFVKADLLVYWLPAESKITDAIPDDAILLGVFSPSSPLPLSPGSVSKPGVLVLYSLGDHEIVDVSKSVTL